MDDTRLIKENACLETIVKIQRALLKSKDVSSLYDTILFDIRQAMGASRAYLFRNSLLLDGQPVYSLVAESHLAHLSKRIELATMTALPHTHLPRWTTILSHGGLVAETQSKAKGEERFFMATHNVRSLLLAPLLAENRFLGFLGVDDCDTEREWGSLDQELIEDIALSLAYVHLHQDAARDLMYTNQEKIELMEILAHDLKNPMSGILLAVDILAKKYEKLSKEEIEKRLISIRDCVGRMKSISESLLLGHSPFHSKPQLNLEPVGLANLIETIVQSLQMQASAKQIELIVEASKEVPKARADRIAMLQVLENLVSNAIKFSPFDRKVWIRLYRHRSRVRISVTDQGLGIKPEEMNLLFQKQAQLSAKPTGGESSTGYGLWICKTLVDAMRGRIWCESSAGKGATFIVELPIAKEEESTSLNQLIIN
ncbi:MAG: HAMP domain-containing sensor histidine kinase [Chloroherpetonaceae bacterium]|nr:HAMP domain-containing histidine kinase [Chloroherpetonaceae bacterium]MCS7211978.1 HAMP domain-containing histidine kinase [Chloroherpetonaceae bacterium]MDW8020419.1 HAMP domain-containing sensor histidine kinase [Chloroherpetonaceae bacterium]